MDKHKPLITEDEIRRIFDPPKPKRKLSKILRNFARELIIILVIFVVTFGIINWPAISSKIGYWWKTVTKQNAQQIKTNPTQNQPQNTLKDAPSLEPKILISKIGIEAPVIWNIPYEQIHDNLKDGVVHYAGTAHPGEIGNIFLTGHSSDYVWNPGNYKQVFALLDKLAPGDIVTLWYKGKIYEYSVTETKVVKPTETSVINPTPEPILTLMTCYPVGTTKSRLIVRAKLTSPYTQKMQMQFNTPSSKPLPSPR